jgi:hypothetical protein
METQEEMSRYFWSASTNCLPVGSDDNKTGIVVFLMSGIVVFLMSGIVVFISGLWQCPIIRKLRIDRDATT